MMKRSAGTESTDWKLEWARWTRELPVHVLKGLVQKREKAGGEEDEEEEEGEKQCHRKRKDWPVKMKDGLFVFAPKPLSWLSIFLYVVVVAVSA